MEDSIVLAKVVALVRQFRQEPYGELEVRVVRLDAGVKSDSRGSDSLAGYGVLDGDLAVMLQNIHKSLEDMCRLHPETWVTLASPQAPERTLVSFYARDLRLTTQAGQQQFEVIRKRRCADLDLFTGRQWQLRVSYSVEEPVDVAEYTSVLKQPPQRVAFRQRASYGCRCVVMPDQPPVELRLDLTSMVSGATKQDLNGKLCELHAELELLRPVPAEVSDEHVAQCLLRVACMMLGRCEGDRMLAPVVLVLASEKRAPGFVEATV